MSPKVSIIVPTYNVENYLVECMESIVNQTLKDIEIICVDDGSKDNSGKILDEYASKDCRIKVIHKENGGYGKAMNVGLDNATGEYIGIVEPDDYVALDMYETLYDKAVEENVDFIKADFYRFIHDEDGNLKLYYNKLDHSEEYYDRVVNPQDDVTPFCFIMNTWSGIYKKSFLDKYNIRHNETPGASFQDNGFWFQTFCRAKRVYFLNEPFYMNRRDNPNSSVKNKEKVFCMKEEYDYIKEFLNNNPELKKKFIYIYQYKRFHNYEFNMRRIDISFKKMFLKIFTQDYRQAYKDGEIDESLFSPSELKALRLVVKNPNKYYRKKLNRLSLVEKLFSVKNQREHKVLRFFGLKFKFKSKKLIYRQNFENIYSQLNTLNSKLKKSDNLIEAQNSKIENLNNTIKKLQNDINNTNRALTYKIHKYCPDEKRALALSDWYVERTGNTLNLNNPQTFNEKIQWMKLYDSTPIKTRLADKYLVRDWVKERIGEEYLIPLLGVWDNFDDINFDELPNDFVLKCNHGCGYNIIVKDKSKLNIKNARKKINNWMNEDFAYKYGLELHYSPIQRKIIAEKYIENGEGDLYDYKFWCFDGKVQYIQFLSERNTNGLKMAFYDTDWNKQDFAYTYPLDEKTMEKPDNLSEMIYLAENLSNGFNHVRVDFYRLNDGKIYFGEMTFTSCSGVSKWQPKNMDLVMGNLIALNCTKAGSK